MSRHNAMFSSFTAFFLALRPGRHRPGLRLTLSLLAAVALTTAGHAAAPEPADPVRSLLGGLPLSFIHNQGQVDPRIAYYLQGHDATVYFTPEGVTFALRERAENARREVGLTPMPRPEAKQKQWVVKLEFVGARPGVRPEGEERMAGVVSYFTGSQEQWQTGVATYGKVVYRELWPGIDLEYSGTGQRLKYTFVVKPGADPQRIRLAYRGATKLTRVMG